MIRVKSSARFAFAVVIIFAEEVEIKHEAQYEDADVQNLPCQHQSFLPDGLAALDGLFAQAFEDIVGFPAHYLAAVDDFLPLSTMPFAHE